MHGGPSTKDPMIINSNSNVSYTAFCRLGPVVCPRELALPKSGVLINSEQERVERRQELDAER